MTAQRLLIAVVCFAVVLVLASFMLSGSGEGLATGADPSGAPVSQGARAGCVQAWNDAVPDRPAVGSRVYVTASGSDYCDVEFVEPDGDVGIWQYNGAAVGWSWLAPTDGAKTVLLAPDESLAEGLDVDENGNLVGLVPTDG